MSTLLTGTLLAMALDVSAGGANITLGETREFGDWVAGCDNALTCEAVALTAAQNSSNYQSLLIQRSRNALQKEDPGQLKVVMRGLNTAADRYRVIIDDKIVDTGAINQRQHSITVSAADAKRLTQAIAQGYQMRIEDGAGKTIGEFSLKGSASSLRYFDTKMGLAGTGDALVAKGRRNAPPLNKSLPVIAAKRVTQDGPIPGTDELISFLEASPCSANRVDVREDRIYSLGRRGTADQALLLLGCGGGGDNSSTAVYVASSNNGGKWTFEKAPFDLTPLGFAGGEELPMLINANWTPDGQQLSSFAKNRGSGDCGEASSYVWDGTMFRLSGASKMPACRGSMEWITVWRADIQFSS
jgi:hypothetical protein